jgi:RNA polymerase sigma-54 factor
MATSLSLTQQQKQMLKLSPAQIQVMRMLEVPTCDLIAQINEELQNNPALEEGVDKSTELDDMDNNPEEDFDNPLQNEDFDYNEYTQDDDISEHIPSQAGSNRPQEEIPFSMGTSFAEYLKSQIYLTKMDKPDRHIAKFVVGNIDEDGYLHRTTEELVDDLSFREGILVEDSKMQEIIDQIKQFDPAGVGAHDLQECLLIQIKQKPSTPSIDLAHKILANHFEHFSKHNFERVKQKLNIDDSQLKQAIAEIHRLNPKPGSAWKGTLLERNQEIVIPDFIVENQDDKLVVSLNNSDIPPLHVSADYTSMLETYNQPAGKTSARRNEEGKVIKQYVDSARTFIDAIRQRNETMMRAMQALVKLQREYFIHGDSIYLKPMILKDVADKSGYDVSTISRTFNNKYVQTDFGIIALKFFFSEGMTDNRGNTISTREIKQRLQEIIAQEDKHNPVTDDELVEIMHQSGYPIARRTVAKYRDQLNIPVARLRKQI